MGIVGVHPFLLFLEMISKLFVEWRPLRLDSLKGFLTKFTSLKFLSKITVISFPS